MHRVADGVADRVRLAALRSLFERVGPVPPQLVIAPLTGSMGGTWTVYQLGQGWIMESLNGKTKIQNPERIIQAARAAGATIRWLD